MQFYILAGENVFGKKKSRVSDTLLPHPFSSMILVVNRGSLLVPEAESANGYARIVCHQSSERDGTYWYEYTNKSGQGVSEDVIMLWNGSRGNPTTARLFGQFIKD